MEQLSAVKLKNYVNVIPWSISRSTGFRGLLGRTEVNGQLDGILSINGSNISVLGTFAGGVDVHNIGTVAYYEPRKENLSNDAIAIRAIEYTDVEDNVLPVTIMAWFHDCGPVEDKLPYHKAGDTADIAKTLTGAAVIDMTRAISKSTTSSIIDLFSGVQERFSEINVSGNLNMAIVHPNQDGSLSVNLCSLIGMGGSRIIQFNPQGNVTGVDTNYLTEIDQPESLIIPSGCGVAFTSNGVLNGNEGFDYSVNFSDPINAAKRLCPYNKHKDQSVIVVKNNI